MVYRLADEAELSSTTEQKLKKQSGLKAISEGIDSAKHTFSKPDMMTVLKSTADLSVNVAAPK